MNSGPYKPKTIMNNGPYQQNIVNSGTYNQKTIMNNDPYYIIKSYFE